MAQILHFSQWLETCLHGLVHSNLPAFYLVLFLVVFCETGLVVTPFLPGDSLLFLVGAMAATTASGVSLPVLIVALTAAAVLGDAVNYSVGWRVGPRVFQYEKSWLFNKKHLLRAQTFYEKYGSKTIILARFVPIVRTFAPFVAGVGVMRYRKFFLYNVIGAAAWVTICSCGGFFFGNLPWVRQNFEAVLVAIVALSVLPMAVEFVLAWWKRRAAKALGAKIPTLPDDLDWRNLTNPQGITATPSVVPSTNVTLPNDAA